uniref:Uncharacterized protein n=1 Tax=Caenorhabditis japonica TaxID=281687 RepID=A0A8R1E0E3_CAEJA
MSDYDLLLHNSKKEDKYGNTYYRYRLSIFYYLVALIVVIILIANFRSYYPADSESNSLVSQKQTEGELPITTTQPAPSTPFNYENLPPCNLEKPVENKMMDPSAAVTQFFNCAKMILMRFVRSPEEMLFNWPYTVYVCDEEDEVAKIPLKSFDNGEKQYWALLPKCKEPSTLVTLGTGPNQKSEENLKSMIKNLTTFGTDPFLKDNMKYDHFYQAAISNSSNNLEIEHKNVHAFDQATFFNETIGAKKIDMLWINPNGGNFEYWKYLNINGTFDSMGIKLCQLNIEIQKKDAGHWHELITPLVKDKRYIFMRPMATKNGNVTRTFFVNAQDPECTRKYLE